jgi:subtilase family serine protease
MLRRVVPVLAVGALTAGVLVAPGAAALPGQVAGAVASRLASEPVGSGPSLRARLAAAPQVDTRAEDPDVTFVFGLPRDSAALDAAAQERSTPGNLLYRDHPSLVNAGKSYGTKTKTLARLRAAATALGIEVKVDPGRILARLTAPVSVWNKAYGLRMKVTEPTPGNPYRTFAMLDGGSYAKPPASLAKYLAEALPLGAVYVPIDDVVGIDPDEVAGFEATLASPGTPQAWPRNAGTLPPGTCTAPALRDRAVFAPGQIQTAYGTTALAAKGVRGKGARLTVISLGGGYDADDLARAAECFGYRNPRIDIVTGTGVDTPFVNASVETHLDLITASAALPDAESLTLLQTVNPVIGITDAFARMVDGKTVPDVASLSYSVCEPEYAEELTSYVALNEDLLRMAAIVGTTVVVATGDSGSSMCGAGFAEETGDPSVGYPSTSAWVTAVGGTRLALKADNTRRSERVWNDLPYTANWPAPGPAGAGGASMLIDRPWWQPGPTPIGPRTVPDVALLGAIRPGWPIVYGGEVFTVGGTSGGTPFLGANLAAMSAHQRARGFPSIGFANAWLYSAAAGNKPAFVDITSGSNAVQLVGCCSAYRGYDMASGLGAPIMDGLYATLPRPAG